MALPQRLRRPGAGRPAPLDGSVEESLPATGFDHPDFLSFGVRGVFSGFAGRSGVAYDGEPAARVMVWVHNGHIAEGTYGNRVAALGSRPRSRPHLQQGVP
ncbi:hypothetical protein [Streptomyces californicus]|uniref:hypothetical protein n=1 Tax=Streptomyces californicus TaxID=67351 RepID=UPI0036CC0DE0